MWFSQQPRNETKPVFITYQCQEILDRKLSRILKRFNKKLSVSRPFIHKRRASGSGQTLVVTQRPAHQFIH